VAGGNSLPYGKIGTPQALGALVRARRREQGASQAELASLCGIGVRFLSDLENGKPTVELGKVLQVLACLGLDVHVMPRGWASAEPAP